MTFGLQTVLAWDLDRVQAVGKDLQAHEQQLRACFADFRGSSDLAHAWSGAAADAQHVAAARLATDLYDLSDMIGLLGNQIGRKGAELVEYQTAIRHARSDALSSDFDVADDGTVTLPAPKPGEAPLNAPSSRNGGTRPSTSRPRSCTTCSSPPPPTSTSRRLSPPPRTPSASTRRRTS